MSVDTLSVVVAKEEIRSFVLLYARGINRKELRPAPVTLHGRCHRPSWPVLLFFRGRFRFPFARSGTTAQRCSSLFVCNHLITVYDAAGEGEVYALSYHFLPRTVPEAGRKHQMRLRYLDTYRKEGGRWLFASRTLVIDHHVTQPVPAPEGEQAIDPSYTILEGRVFQAGPRA